MMLVKCCRFTLLLVFVCLAPEAAGQSGDGSGQHGDVRLINGYQAYNGVLQLFYEDHYLPFVIEGFNMHAADLACQQLGYSYAFNYGTASARGFAGVYSSMSISNVSCNYTATSLGSCLISVAEVTTGLRSVGISCTDYKTPIRLVRRSGDRSGRVISGRLELLVNTTWGTVCDNNFTPSHAKLACQELHLQDYITYNNASNLDWDTSSLARTPIWLDNSKDCDFGSADLRQCTYAVGFNNCSHNQDIILTCKPEPSREFSPGIIVGLIVGPLALFTALCVSAVLCVIRVGVFYRKKKAASPGVTGQSAQAMTTDKEGDITNNDSHVVTDDEPLIL